MLLGPVLLAGCRTTYRGPTPHLRRHVVDVPFENRIPTLLVVRLHHGRLLVRPGRELAGRLSVEVSGATEQEAIALSERVGVQLTEENRFVTRLGITHPLGVGLEAVHVVFQLVVPPHVRLRVRTVRGEVRLLGFRGEADVENARGVTNARIGEGRCSLRTISGVLQLSGGYREARLESREGPVRVELPQRVGGTRLEVRSGSGPVTVLAPASCRLAIDFTSRSGRVRCSLPAAWRLDGVLGPDRRRSWQGTVGPAHAPQCAGCRIRSESAPLLIDSLPASQPAVPARAPTEESPRASTRTAATLGCGVRFAFGPLGSRLGGPPRGRRQPQRAVRVSRSVVVGFDRLGAGDRRPPPRSKASVGPGT